MATNRIDQGFGDSADAPGEMDDPTPGQIQGRSAVERVGPGAGGLGGDQQLSIHEETQSFR